MTNRGEFSRGPSDEVVLAFARPTRLEANVTHDMAVPRQVLLGFTRVTIGPGQTRTVRIGLDPRALRLLGPDGRFGLLPGAWEIAVGGRAPGPSVATARDSGSQPGTAPWVQAPLTAELLIEATA